MTEDGGSDRGKLPCGIYKMNSPSLGEPDYRVPELIFFQHRGFLALICPTKYVCYIVDAVTKGEEIIIVGGTGRMPTEP